MRGSIGMLAMHWLLSPQRRSKRLKPECQTVLQATQWQVRGSRRLSSRQRGGSGVLLGSGISDETGSKRAFAISPERGAAIYAKICQRWGEDHLKGFDGIERLGELSEQVVANSKSPWSTALRRLAIENSLSTVQEEQCSCARP